MKVTKKKSFAVQAVVLVSLTVLAVLPAAGAERATMSVLGGEIVWAPQGSSERYVLRVSGPDMHSLQRFNSGEAGVFSLFDDEGETLADGSYTWELRGEMAPVNDGIHDPANGRDGASTEERTPERGSYQLDFGAFTVRNGAVVDPYLDEVRQPKSDQ